MTAAPPRPSMSKVRRLRIFVKEDGRCYLCGDKVKIGQLFEVEHVIPWALSFDDTDDNLKIAHTVCHKTMKTGDDVARIAKAKAQGGETGQWARRQKRDEPLMKSRPFPKGGPKQKIPSRGWERKTK